MTIYLTGCFWDNFKSFDLLFFTKQKLISYHPISSKILFFCVHIFKTFFISVPICKDKHVDRKYVSTSNRFIS